MVHGLMHFRVLPLSSCLKACPIETVWWQLVVHELLALNLCSNQVKARMAIKLTGGVDYCKSCTVSHCFYLP